MPILQVKFDTSLLASLAGDEVYLLQTETLIAVPVAGLMKDPQFRLVKTTEAVLKATVVASAIGMPPGI